MKNPFKRAVQAILRRIFGPLFFGLALFSLSGCATSMFKRDPMVEVVRSITSANVEIVRAMTEALSRAQAAACAVPTPEGGR